MNTNTKTSPTHNTNTKKITNWSKYNQSLINRGNIILFIDKELSAPGIFFRGEKQNPNKRGRKFIYPDYIIQLIALLRELSHNPLRQVTGLALGIFGIKLPDFPIPHYSTVCRRMKDLSIPTGATTYRKSQNLVILVDSTGLKIAGEGEWTVRKHGKHYARDWRKVHLAIDYASQDIISVTTTHADAHDIKALDPLLQQCKEVLKPIKGSKGTKDCPRIDKVIGDAAYGSRPAHAIAAAHSTTIISPPNRRSHVKVKDKDPTRNEYIMAIHYYGMEKWKKDVGYHRRSLAETGMYRLKAIFGSSLRSRTEINQITEIRLRARLINSFNTLGLPEYVAGIN